MTIAEQLKDVYIILVRVFFTLIFILFYPTNLYTQVTFWDDIPDNELAELLIDDMGPEELLGQVLLWGYGFNNYRSYYWDDIEEEMTVWIKDRNLGGIKPFGWNGSNLKKLASEISTMQSFSQSTRHKIPLIVATDQEGGWIRHIKGGMSMTPGNIAIGATGNMEDAYETGYYIGLELKAAGINMNFAPTVDLYTNYDNIVIGPRAFSDDPDLTAKLGLGYYLGLDKAGVMATAKHFPGHGDTEVDSHGDLPIISIDFETLWNRELVPYRLLINEKLPAIMVGHIGYPLIDRDLNPASFSKIFIEDIIRGKLGFDGLLITDDLIMGGTESNSQELAEMCYRALNVGNDLILVSRTNEAQNEVWYYLSDKLKSNDLFLEKIKEKVKRILLCKMRYLKREDAAPLYPDSESILNNIPNKNGEAYFIDHAFRSATVLRSSELPLKIENNEKILLAGQVDAFFSVGRELCPEADTYDYGYNFYSTSSQNKADMINFGKYYDIIIFCIDGPGSEEALKALDGSPARIFVISVYSPVYFKDVPWIKNAVAVYGSGTASIRAGFYTLMGEYMPDGKLPLNLDLGFYE